MHQGISANPLIIYLNGFESTMACCNEMERITGCQIDRDIILSQGYTYIDLSKSIRKNTALTLCESLSNEIMAEQDYIDLKNICYSPLKNSKILDFP